MAEPIRIPEDLWNDDTEGVIVAWLYDEGAHVERDAIVAEVMVEKAQVEIRAPAAGTLRRFKNNEETVRRGELVGEIVAGASKPG